MPDGLAPFTELADLKRAYAARRLAIFLDVDGTLLEVAHRPDAVHVPAPVRDVLARLLAESGGAVALVSGRLLEDLDQLFAPLTLPAAGLHGLQRRDAAGRIHRRDHSSDLESVRRVLSESAYEDLLIEDKGSAMVVHYRLHPHLERESRALADAAAAAGGALWRVVPGKFSYEIRLAGIGKRDALAAFMREAPFADRTALFCGDDVSDEEGFEYVNETGGWSVQIGNEGGQSAARAHLRGPRQLFHLLAELLRTGAAARTPDAT